MNINYAHWASQYADVLSKHGWIESIVQGWVQDAVDRIDEFNVDAGYIALRALPRK